MRSKWGTEHINLPPTRRSKKALRRRTTTSLLRYGLSVSDYYKILEAQGGVCAICGKKPATINLAVDHDHKIEREHGVIAINGLICRRCNTGLGRFEYSDEVLTNLVKYAKMILINRKKHNEEDKLYVRT